MQCPTCVRALPKSGFVGLALLLITSARPQGLAAQVPWGQYGVTVYQLPSVFIASVAGAAINDFGQVAGRQANTAAFFTPGSGVTTLGTLGGTWSTATSINNAGQIAGSSLTTGNAATHAFIYSGGLLQDLGTLGGTNSSAFGINALGQVVGQANTIGDTENVPFLYNGSTMQNLGSLGVSYGNAWAINNAGQVTGFSYVPAPTQIWHAFLYSAGTMMDLGTLGGPLSVSSGFAINAGGQVVGWGYSLNTAQTAFILNGSTLQALGTLGGSQSFAQSISNSGQVVGSSATSNYLGQATLWSNGGSGYQAYNLNNMVSTGPNSGWSFGNAAAISANGQYILAQGQNGGFSGWAVLQQNPAPTVTPEPSSLALLGTGLAGLALRLRRRRSGQSAV